MVGISADLNIVSCSFRNHPDVKNGDNTKPWKHTTNGKAYCVLKKYITLGKKLAIINKLQSSLKLDRLIIKTCDNASPTRCQRVFTVIDQVVDLGIAKARNTQSGESLSPLGRIRF